MIQNLKVSIRSSLLSESVLKKIFAYLDDGELPIDNNLTERTIRKLTTQRNNSFHYGSDAGAEMATLS